MKGDTPEHEYLKNKHKDSLKNMNKSSLIQTAFVPQKKI